jgi:hypothetical protein
VEIVPKKFYTTFLRTSSGVSNFILPSAFHTISKSMSSVIDKGEAICIISTPSTNLKKRDMCAKVKLEGTHRGKSRCVTPRSRQRTSSKPTSMIHRLLGAGPFALKFVLHLRRCILSESSSK